MDPEYSLQDVVRCHLCETPSPSLQCNVCDKHVCKDCEKKHLSDESGDHKIVPFKCQKHPSKICKRYCKQCDIPICVVCASSAEHRGHKHVDVRKHCLQGYLQELHNSIYPTYRDIELNIHVQIIDLIENSKMVEKAINKHGEDMHRKIEIAIKTLKSELDKVDSENLAVLHKQKDQIKHIITEIGQDIANINILLNSNDVGQASFYKSRNDGFKKYPSKSIITLPRFVPHKVNKDLIYQQFGYLSEHNYKVDDLVIKSSPTEKLCIDLAPIITDLKTDYAMLSSMSCQNDEEIWMCAYKDNTIKLYDLQGEIVKSIKPLQEKMPWDIAVTRNGDLVYTDYNKRTVTIVNNTQIEKDIQLNDWIPDGVCSTLSGELLVVMIRYDGKQTKVVSYSGFTEKQIIQYDDKGHPLYSSGDKSIHMYISENRNLDICVSDSKANRVVVVNQAGKYRFKYEVIEESFYPRNIATDSQSRILVADSTNHRIHILDRDGRLLRRLYDSRRKGPCCLCVDTEDNLFVAEMETGLVNKIRYII